MRCFGGHTFTFLPTFDYCSSSMGCAGCWRNITSLFNRHIEWLREEISGEQVVWSRVYASIMIGTLRHVSAANWNSVSLLLPPTTAANSTTTSLISSTSLSADIRRLNTAYPHQNIAQRSRRCCVRGRWTRDRSGGLHGLYWYVLFIFTPLFHVDNL